jgi:hypothetical protein
MEINPIIEFEPVSTGENTEVKIPVTAHDVTILNAADDNDTCISPCFDQQTTGHGPHIDNSDTTFFYEYNRLISLFRGMPSVTFVATLVRDYASSESDLDNVRSQLFEALKSNEDFPYGIDSELKRRVFRGRGDPISIKLANDIHTLLSVMEGEEYSVIKEMISATKVRASSQSSTQQTPRSTRKGTTGTGTTLNTTPCHCNIEIQMLKDTVSSLQADILLLKQMSHANDKLRTDQVNCVCSTVKGITQDIVDCKRQITEAVSEGLSQCNIIKTLSASNEGKLQTLQKKVDSLEHFVDSAGVVKIAQCSKHHTPYHFNSDENTNVETTVGEIFPDADTYFTHTETPSCDQNITEKCLIQNVNDQSEPCSFNDKNEIHTEQCRDLNISEKQCATLKFTEMRVNKACQDASKHTSRPDSRTFSIPKSTFPKMKNIPVRVTTRAERDIRQYEYFDWHVTKPTKRFFVGGFSKSASIQYLSNFIRNRGATVSMIRKFPMRKSPNKVIIRLNLEANENADLVLDPGFWPRGITCSPWLSRTEIRERNNKGNRNADKHSSRIRNVESRRNNRRSIDEFPPFADFNLYSQLDVDVE